MAGLVLTLSIIFVLALVGSVVRLTTRINRLENRLDIMLNNLEQNEQPLLGPSQQNDRAGIIKLGVNKDERIKLPVVISGETYFVPQYATIEEFVMICGKPDRASGDANYYELIYFCNPGGKSIQAEFTDGELSEIKHF